VITAGIDYDTHAVHVVLLDADGAPSYYRFDLCSTGDAFDRTRVIRDAMPARVSVFWSRVQAIGIEEPRGDGNGALLRVQGAILASLPPLTLVAPYGPSQWRVGAGLSGGASKATVRDWSLEHGGLESWPQDAHDAHAIAHAVRNAARLGSQAA
jgi:hypothetical protein